MNTNAELFILLIEDAHTGTDAFPYSTWDLANAALDDWVAQSSRYPEDVEENDCDAFERSVTYSEEGGHVAIIRRVLDADE